MSTETIYRLREIAIEEGLKHYDLFVDFMTKRFPSESDPYYVAEWARRFMSGDPVSYMDSPSKEVYLNLLDNR